MPFIRDERELTVRGRAQMARERAAAQTRARRFSERIDRAVAEHEARLASGECWLERWFDCPCSRGVPGGYLSIPSRR